MQKRNCLSISLFVTILSLSCGAYAQLQAEGKPGLIINPTRVELEGRERSASITIANNGSVKGDYRIELVNKRMSEDGQLLDAPNTEKGDMFADKILRISPRSVTVEPGSNQSIRILVRKSKDLPDGEYRTHLSVMIVPEDQAATLTDKPSNDKLVIAVKANYGVTIPVIIRSGNVSATAEITEVKYYPAKREEKESARITFNVNRQGDRSLYGDIKILYINTKGEESVVKFMGGMAVYTPNNLRKFEVPLDVADNVAIGHGTMKIIYQEKEKSGGKIIAQKELKL